MDQLVCVKDFENAASHLLTKRVWEYFEGVADDGITRQENRQAFQRWLIRPRVLRNVSSRSLTTTILGKPTSLPIGICPMAFQKLAHLDGEIGSAKAAAAMGTIFVLSTAATCSIEEVAVATPGSRKWFQLYVLTERKTSLELIRRAEKAGYEALVLTVDLAVDGKRRADIKNNFCLPSHLSLANFTVAENISGKNSTEEKDHVSANIDASLTWEDLVWFKQVTKLPILIKGILTAEDALLAVQHGAAAIFVSNHGGRQLDTVSASIDALPEIVKAVGGKCDIYVDGGISSGTDVFKSIALGATAAFVGRPMLWGLAVDGERGAEKVLEIYTHELDLTMALAGVSRVQEITGDYVSRRSLL